MTDARFQDEIMSRLPLDMGDSDVLMIAGAFGWSSEFMAKATSKRSLAKAAVKSSGHIGNLLAKAAPPPPKALANTMIPAAVFATSPKAVSPPKAPPPAVPAAALAARVHAQARRSRWLLALLKVMLKLSLQDRLLERQSCRPPHALQDWGWQAKPLWGCSHTSAGAGLGG